MKKHLLVILLIIQTIIYIIVGNYKQYIHIDEAYSYGLSNYDKVEIQNNEDFYNNWHTKEYYEDYLSVEKDEIKNYAPVYENQKNDVHPPLYYLILRTAMQFTIGHFSKWTGITINIIIYIFITIFMYLILKKILKEEKNAETKATILAFISSITLASISNVIYIRMYSLLTLEILITIFLHIKLLETEKTNFKLLIMIGITILSGILTHYYYLFYLVGIYFIFMIKYMKEKKYRELTYYTISIIIAGIVSLIIFPYSIQHMFFGYRGKGVISNLENISEMAVSIFTHIYNLNYYGFNGLMPVILIIILILFTYEKFYKKKQLKINKEKKEILRIIYIPSIFFFIMSAIGSPWRVLRYIVPICGLFFILAIYFLYKLLQKIYNEKWSNIIISIILCATLISPFILHLEPELLYQDRKEIVEELKGELNLPTIYFYQPQGGSFLDDILLFSIIDESYIAKDIEYTEENIRNIFKDKDISKGIIIFSTEEQNNTNIEMIKKYLNFTNCQHLKKLTSYNVYHIY